MTRPPSTTLTLPAEEKRGVLTAAERETVITKAADEKGWSISTHIPKHARRLAKIAAQWGVSASKLPFGGLEVTLPEKAVRFAAPRMGRKGRKVGA